MKKNTHVPIAAEEDLLLQNEGKEKEAGELLLANRRLAFEIIEKEKRAQELIIANKELAFQNDEKEKRAQELIIANKELAFQNDEKEKRTQELIGANRELKKIEKKLQEANQELEAFSYSVSHDLRAPLRAISGFSTMLKRKYEPSMDAEANRIINVIVDNTKMMSQLIDDLLSFSKMARTEIINRVVHMDMLVQKCIAEILETENQSKYAITVHPMPVSKGDESMLKQVWYNVISNAIKYSSKKDNPKIEIGAIEDHEANVYYIKDNGTGFNMKYADKLFGVFQRLHRQDEFEGTGLGLALAKRILNRHGGRIWATSILQEGTIFYFSIPKENHNGQEI